MCWGGRGIRLRTVSEIMLTLLRACAFILKKKIFSARISTFVLIWILSLTLTIEFVKTESTIDSARGVSLIPSSLEKGASREISTNSFSKELENIENNSSVLQSEHKPDSNRILENLTIWYSPDGYLPTMFNQTEKPSNDFHIEQKYKTDSVRSLETSSNLVCVLINSSIYDGIDASIQQFISDVEVSGFSIEVYDGSWGTAENIREFLYSKTSSGIVGAILIGDIPSAWYEMDQPVSSGFPEHEEFPTDLFYMDLDGNWSDEDDDELYDAHDGNIEPEIWVGRLKASNIPGDEVSLLNNYFLKNHRVRTGSLSVPKRALAYIDDDWIASANADAYALEQIYPETILVSDTATTNAQDYKARISEGYEWVHLRCHGSSYSHTFKINGNWDGSVSSYDYLSIDPPVLFYQLFVCSGARYVEDNYLGGACIFADTYGVIAVGSTKTGSMLFFEDFYGSLAEGNYVGAAFRDWFQLWGELDPKWFYGLTILGDPTLYIPSMPTSDLSVSLKSPVYLKPNDSSCLNATVYNKGTELESDIELFLLIDDITVESVTIPELEPGSSYTIHHVWTPSTTGIYNVTVNAPVLHKESIVINNLESNNVVVTPSDILLVNDDDGNNLFTGTSLPEFESALKTIDYDYFVWNQSLLGNPPLDLLTNFKLVIWTCGDYYNGAVDLIDALTLQSYLTQDGNLLLEGGLIGYDHQADYNDEFMVNVAHALYEVLNAVAPGLTVTEPSHPVVNGLPSSFDWGFFPLYPDGVSPTNGGAEVIQYNNTVYSAVVVFGSGGSESVVYMAFPLHCLDSPEQETLAKNSVNWLLEPPNQLPVGDAGGPYIGSEGEEISFDGSGSYDNDGTIVSYLWDFGDGETSTEQNPIHVYAQDGNYDVWLTVTDDDYATDEEMTMTLVVDVDPVADFSASPISGTEPLPVELSDLSASYDMISSWLWDFGDGVTSTEQNPVHVFSEGTYTVSLTVQEGDGDSDTETKTDLISVLATSTQETHLVVRGSDNGIYYRPYNSGEGTWGNWIALPGSTCDSPAAAIYEEQLYLIVRGMDGNSLWFGSVDLSDDSFSGWSYLSGATPSKPTLVSYGNKMVLVVRGTDNRIYHRQYNLITDSWGSWNAVPTGTTVDSPAAAIDGDYLHLVVRGMDDDLYHQRVYLPTLNYLGWSGIGGTTPSAPTLTSNYRSEGDDNLLYLVVRGSDDGIYLRSYDGSWSSWTSLPGSTNDAVGACIQPSKPEPDATLHIVVRGMTGGLYHGKYDLNSESFLDWSWMSGSTPSPPTLTS